LSGRAQREGAVSPSPGAGAAADTAADMVAPATSRGSMLRSARASTKAPSSALRRKAIDSSRAEGRGYPQCTNHADPGVDPLGEHLGGEPGAMLFVGAGHLEGDGGDRAGVREVGLDQQLGRVGEGDPAWRARGRFPDSAPRPPGLGTSAGGTDHLRGQLLLAAGGRSGRSIRRVRRPRRRICLSPVPTYPLRRNSSPDFVKIRVFVSAMTALPYNLPALFQRSILAHSRTIYQEASGEGACTWLRWSCPRDDRVPGHRRPGPGAGVPTWGDDDRVGLAARRRRAGPDFRCVVPTLPLGGHRQPMRPDADLSLAGLAVLVDEFLERLDLREVTLVQNDWGGAQVMVALGRDERIAPAGPGRLRSVRQHYPPGVPGRVLQLAARVPRGAGQRRCACCAYRRAAPRPGLLGLE